MSQSLSANLPRYVLPDDNALPPPQRPPGVKRMLAALLLVVLAGCTPQAAPAPDPSLSTLRQIDDLPLYEMTFVGDYDALTGIAGSNPPSPFGCSLFVTGDRLFARNFDWDANPALLLHTDPPDGYASVSLVDVSYLGVRDFRDRPRELLKAPLLPFDGMNEKGLAIGMAADEAGKAPAAAGKPTIGSIRVMRLVLDSAATVDEALAVFDRYNLDFAGGPPLHYLIADAAGGSAVVEFVNGVLRIERGGSPWQGLTNFPLIEADAATRAADHRYATLQQHRDVVGPQAALGVLRAVAQSHTRWSVVYEMRTGAVHVVTGQRWDRVHRFTVR